MRTFWDVECRDAEGNLRWTERGLPNLLHDEGEKAILSAYFDTDSAGFGPPPSSLYVGLRTEGPAGDEGSPGSNLAEGDTLASGLTEVSGTGYARQAISTSSGFTLSQVGGDWRATSGSATFTAGGTWTGAKSLFLCTVVSGTSGKLIASVVLSTTRTLVNGDTLTCSCYVVLSE